MRPHLAVGLTAVTIALLLLFVPGSLPRTTAAPASGPAFAVVGPAAAVAPNPFWSGMPASVAIGQPNLTSASSPTQANQSNIIPDPELSCMDASGNLWVPNFGGARVTEYLAPLSTNESASLVIGQSGFYSDLEGINQSTFGAPASCTFDSHGDLWVPDFFGGRVLEFVPPFSNGMNASLVLGAPNFNSTGGTATASTFGGPASVAFDAQGNLYVADASANRILEFTPPFSTGMSASAVLGQTTFLGVQGGTTAVNLSFPIGLGFGGGVLWVADADNGRVLGFPTPAVAGEGARYVLGQPNFTSLAGVGEFSLNSPESVAVDAQGNLWVSDSRNNRVLEYVAPLATNESPSVVIGQTSFLGIAPGTSPTTLSFPLGAFTSPTTGDLIVSDGSNDRVLEYVPSSYPVKFVATGLPASAAWSVTFAGASESGSASGIDLIEWNGSYAWSAAPVAGYVVAPASGVLNLNGTGATITLAFTPVTFSVTFNAIGLPSTATWTVTLDGVAHSGAGDAAVSFAIANGSYSYSVASVSGYTTSPASGTVSVAGEPQEVGIGFFSTSSGSPSGSGSSSNGISPLLAALLAVVGLIVGAVVGVLIGRRRGGSPPPPPSPSTLSPPAKATSVSPPAPWSESPSAPSGPGTPPPGALQ